MTIWAASLLFVTSIFVMVELYGQYRKHKKLRFIVLAVVTMLLSLTLFVYAIATVILVGGVR